MSRQATGSSQEEGPARAAPDSGAESNAEAVPSLRMLRPFLDALPCPVFVKDGNNVVVFANRAAAALAERTPEQVVGLRTPDLHTNAAEADAFLEADRRVLAAGEVTHQAAFTPPRGGTRHFECVRKRIAGDDGEPLALSIGVDVTLARNAELASVRRLREVNSFLRSILDVLPVGVFVKTLEPGRFGQFVEWNRRLAEIGRLRSEDVLGRTIRSIYPEGGQAMERSDAAAIACDGPLKIAPTKVTSTDGTEVWFETTKVVLRDDEGQPRWLVGITADVGARMAAEAAREEALRRANEASALKSQFVAHMSHEIRTPMTGVLGLISLALERDMPDDVRELLDGAARSAEQLLGVLNGILDVAKIESGRLDLERRSFSLRSALRDCAVLLQGQAARKNLDLALAVDDDVPEQVTGDVTRLRQIVINLGDNAIKFTPAGTIRIHAGVRRHHTSGAPPVVISIEDTGIGIPADQLETIFKRFHQADASTTRRFGGTGLGLTICRELARLMGGDVQVSSVVGQGSRFEVVLPFHAAADRAASEGRLARAAPADTARASDTRPVRALLAEDNVINTRVAVRMLESMGCCVTHAADGVQALAAFEAGSFDLVLLDIHMPEMDGLECARAIRRVEAARGGRRALLVALTANSMRGDDALSTEAGMDGHLSKPIDRAALREVVAAARLAHPNAT